MKKNSTLFLTGLRGYSALAVFLIHSGGGGLKSFGSLGNKWVDLGKYGVISFFVLSAMTLTMSISRSTRFSYSRYLFRRFARIFPMYGIVVFLFWSLGGLDEYQKMFGVPKVDGYDLFMHITFLNLWDVRYQATIIGIEWTVPIEMWTYLIIPPLFFILLRCSEQWKWIVFLCALIVAGVCPQWHETNLGAHWAIESYLYCFVGGILAYIYSEKLNWTSRKADIVVAILIVFALFPPGSGRTLELWFTILAMALIVVLPSASHMRWVFENRLVVFIGNVSFSFYLLHFQIIRYLTEQHYSVQIIFFAGLIATSGAAYLCHIFIEKPALSLTGKQHPYDS
jgi:peptidoglycan/LPS O-acetylase OafA/YrhL